MLLSTCIGGPGRNVIAALSTSFNSAELNLNKSSRALNKFKLKTTEKLKLFNEKYAPKNFKNIHKRDGLRHQLLVLSFSTKKKIINKTSLITQF